MKRIRTTIRVLIGTTVLAGGTIASRRSPAARCPATLHGSTAGASSNGIRGVLATTGVAADPLLITGNAAQTGGGIVAFHAGSTTLTRTTVTVNRANLTTGGVYRQGGAMVNNTSTISANTPTNCAGSSPAVPGCTG